VRLAAIDLGSNSVHMVVADVTADGRIQVVDRVKEMVRLGRKSFMTGTLTSETTELAERAVTTFSRLARARHVQHIRAVATSAVREAKNGQAFVRRLRRETGLPIEIISGLDEARLIFRAVRHAMRLEDGTHLLLDVGGGSVELTLVEDGRLVWMRSVPLGVARLSSASCRAIRRPAAR
jgi:exopolyphosphatase/guanosine-5'-triphosphate,3'-diphosphate pyrophosphatase